MGDGAQTIVAAKVAIVIVVFLEIVDVDHQDAEGLCCAGRIVPELVDLHVERASIEQPGQTVTIRLVLQFCVGLSPVSYTHLTLPTSDLV